MGQRYNIVFSINEATVGEEYLGEFAVTDKQTGKDYTFYVRGDQDSLDPEYVDEGTVRFPHIYVEDFYEEIDKNQFKSGEDLSYYIDDRRISCGLDEILSLVDLESVDNSIIHFLKTGENEPVTMVGDGSQEGFERYIVSRETADMLIRTKDEGFTKADLIGFAETCQNVQFYLSDEIKQTLKADFEQVIGKEAFSISEAHKSLELFNSLQLPDVTTTFYKQLPEAYQTDLRYSVNVHSKPSSDKSEFELANVKIQDNLLNKSYNFAIWGDEETFAPEYLQKSEIGATHIWVRQIEDDINLKEMASVEDLKTYLDDETLHSLNIKEFFMPNLASNVAQKLVYHHLSEEPFNMRIEEPFFLQKCVPYFAAHEEVAEMAIKAKGNTLTRKDVLSFAEVVKQPQLNLDYCDLDFLEKPILQACRHSLHKPADKKMVKEIFEKLNLNTKLLRFNQLEHTR